jgi:hypothetical protein
VKQAVIDASVAAKWVVEEPHSACAVLALAYDARHAPDHWLAEAANVLWSKVIGGDLTASDAEERMAVLLRAPVITAPLAGDGLRCALRGVVREARHPDDHRRPATDPAPVGRRRLREADRLGGRSFGPSRKANSRELRRYG